MSHEANIFIFCVASCMWNLSLTSLTSTKQRLRKTCLLLLYSYPKLAFWMCLSALQQVWLNGHLCLLRLREWFLGKQIDSQIICTSSHHSLGKKSSSTCSTACVFWVSASPGVIPLLVWVPVGPNCSSAQCRHWKEAKKRYFSMFQDRIPPDSILAKMERECCTPMVLLCLEHTSLLDQCFAVSSLV